MSETATDGDGVNVDKTRGTRRGWLRDSSVAFAAGAAGRAAGVVLTMFIARRLGATRDTDAFYLSLSVTVYLSEIVRMAVEGAFLPAFVAARARGEREANAFFAGTATLFGGSALMLAVLIAISAAAQARRGAWGPFSVLSLHYLSWLAFFLVPSLIAAAANMVFYALHSFAVPALSPLVQTIVVLAALVLYSATNGAGALVGGYLAGGALQLAVLFLLLKRRGATLRLTRPGAAVLSACRAATPIALGGVLINANAVADKIIAGWLLPAGNITILENAGRVYAILSVLTYSALANVFTTRWSELAASADPAAVRRSFSKTMWPAAIVVTLVGLGTALASRPLVDLLFGHGAYSADALAPTAACLAFLALGLPMFFVSGMSARYLYASGVTFVSMTGAALALAVNVPADIVLGNWLGVTGIAAATTVTYAVMTAYMLWQVRAHAGRSLAPTAHVAYGSSRS